MGSSAAAEASMSICALCSCIVVGKYPGSSYCIHVLLHVTASLLCVLCAGMWRVSSIGPLPPYQLAAMDCQR